MYINKQDRQGANTNVGVGNCEEAEDDRNIIVLANNISHKKGTYQQTKHKCTIPTNTKK